MMFQAPEFWSHQGLIPKTLSPLSPLTSWMTARRVAQPGWPAPIPVICCGNATVGGAGKTTVVIDLAKRLRDSHILTKGYGGSGNSLRRVSPDDSVETVGDEPLLLAQIAPTWRCADRARGARVAIEAGAKVVIMDDGLQNPTLAKTLSLLIIDGVSGFGNGRTLPAGPLREPIEAAVARCQAAVLVGDDEANVIARLPPELPILFADLAQDRSVDDLVGQKILPFTGIGRPEKFFKPLRDAGAILVQSRAFPDHHPYTLAECHDLLKVAQHYDSRLVTTPKDAVRLPTAFSKDVAVVGVELRWRDISLLNEILSGITLVEPCPPRY
jgi:tetraacyldisaccharide 4'-kinase